MPENHLYYGDNLDVLRRYVRGAGALAREVGAPGISLAKSCTKK